MIASTIGDLAGFCSGLQHFLHRFAPRDSNAPDQQCAHLSPPWAQEPGYEHIINLPDIPGKMRNGGYSRVP